MKNNLLNIGLNKNNIETVSKILKKVLANNYVLYTKTQVSHWNVEDPRFYALHKMFEEQYQQLAEANDDIAEKLRAIGVKTPLSLNELIQLGDLSEYQQDLNANDMLKSLLNDHQEIIKYLREAIKVCEDNNDLGTADFLTARLEEHEKTAWMLRSSV